MGTWALADSLLKNAKHARVKMRTTAVEVFGFAVIVSALFFSGWVCGELHRGQAPVENDRALIFGTIALCEESMADVVDFQPLFDVKGALSQVVATPRFDPSLPPSLPPSPEQEREF